MINELKISAAKAALAYIEDNSIIGVGTGSTANCFIKELAKIKHRIEACVPSSIATAEHLREVGLPVIDLNAVDELPLYIDGADEVNDRCELIKGGGGALTREKIVATVATRFICLVDDSKVQARLGTFPIAVEVLPLARSFVARELVKLGGDPAYRQGFVTDNGNLILDVFNLPMDLPIQLEEAINLIPGVIENGLFAKRLADLVLVASAAGVRTLCSKA